MQYTVFYRPDSNRPPSPQQIAEMTAPIDAQDEFRRCAAVLGRQRETRAWLVGDAPTVADFAVAVTLPHAEAAHMPLDDYPTIGRWHEPFSAR